MTREEIINRVDALLDVIEGCGPAVTQYNVRLHFTSAVRATLEEAARAVCADCAAGVPLLTPITGWTWAHPDDDYYRYDCAACRIHDLIAALEKP